MSSTRRIDKSTFSAIGFGAMGIASSAFYGAVDSDKERFKVLDAAGCTFWDTLDLYGDSEKLIRKWFKRTGKRDDLFLCSKFGVTLPSFKINGSPEYVKTAVESTLRNLGVDHRPLDHASIIHDSHQAYHPRHGGVRQGRQIKHLGLDECSAETLCPADVQAVREVAAAADSLQGGRLPDALMGTLFADTPASAWALAYANRLQN
ncbi:NADP-dependent oxidoreductase domain-containing protein [Mycena vitilis]|nr:NADP-dependent oxidoreductase domain-containing protein [Mycena vitilis]